MEFWKDVKGYEGLYQVSNYGRIRGLDRMVGYRKGKKRCWKGSIKTPTARKNGYLKINLYKNNMSVTREVQRIVAEAFIDNPMNKEQVNHIDGDKKNNHVENLEWVTQSENVLHSVYVLGHCIKKVGQYDLDGNYIRSFKSVKEAGETTGVARCSISNVIHGRRHKAGNYIWRLEESNG